MKTQQILQFKKSDHFLYSQWDRGLDDKMLYRLLPYVNDDTSNKRVAIFTPSFLKKLKVFKDDVSCLVMVVKNKLLVTAYWCDHPNYLFVNQEEKETRFQILY